MKKKEKILEIPEKDLAALWSLIEETPLVVRLTEESPPVVYADDYAVASSRGCLNNIYTQPVMNRMVGAYNALPQLLEYISILKTKVGLLEYDLEAANEMIRQFKEQL